MEPLSLTLLASDLHTFYGPPVRYYCCSFRHFLVIYAHTGTAGISSDTKKMSSVVHILAVTWLLANMLCCGVTWNGSKSVLDNNLWDTVLLMTSFLI